MLHELYLSEAAIKKKKDKKHNKNKAAPFWLSI